MSRPSASESALQYVPQVFAVCVVSKELPGGVFMAQEGTSTDLRWHNYSRNNRLQCPFIANDVSLTEMVK